MTGKRSASTASAGAPAAAASVWMALAEYDVVREQDDRFALVPGHETEGLERVVARTDR